MHESRPWHERRPGDLELDPVGRMRRVADLLPSVVHMAKRQGFRRIEDVDEADRAQLRVEIAENLHAELVNMYREQRRYGVNAKLGEDDVTFAASWCGWLRYRRDIEQWRLVPEHAAAEHELAAAGGQITLTMAPALVEMLNSRPREVQRVTLSDAPPDWPSQILLWSDALATIIGSRWARASVGREREPGDDDEPIDVEWREHLDRAIEGGVH